jgi:predicted enzyme related to lactoylglutathione lyase
MERNPVNWFEIYVDDMERARKFYEAVLGVKLERLPGPDVEMWTFPMNPDAPNAAGSLVYMPGFKAGGNSVLVYFSCEDCAVEEARVADAGGKIEKTKFSIGDYGFISLIHDSEGNMIGLHSSK